uniref:Protein YIPF n=1 Tax=Caenorhabditis japonica TaxID=281687 RepID=A0A8R1HHV4_CAEJA
MDPTFYQHDAETTRQRSNSNAGGDEKPDQFGMQSQLGKMMWEAGSKQVQDTFKSYGRIDLFRPYFDVEPVEVRSRLIRSFIPRKPSQIQVSLDLYGPSMIVLTMVALLLYNMKSSGIIIQNGTLMGTAMFTCFGSWILISGALWVACFLLAAEQPFLTILSSFGYSLTSQCVVLLLTSLFHSSHDHLFFLVLLGSFCAPAALRVGLIVCQQSRIPVNRLILIGVSIAAHLLLIIYLHFGFHVVLEELDEIVGDAIDVKETISVT